MNKRLLLELLVIASVIFFLLTVCLVLAETLDFNQCKTYYLPNITDNQTVYYPIGVCAPAFPRINANIILDENNPVLILPDYNFSVKISESVFKQNIDLQQKLVDLTKNVNSLTEKVQSLENTINSMNNRLNQVPSEIDAKIQNSTAELFTRISVLESRSRESGTNYTWVLAVVVLVVIMMVYVGIKAGMIKLPRYRAPEFETIEPPKPKKKVVK